jgi:DNA-binding CsgD family transcriptional regulator
MQEKEWQYLLQMIYRLNQAKTVPEFQRLCFSQIKVILPFTKGIFYLAARRGGKVCHYAPVSYQFDCPEEGESRFIERDYPNLWAEYQFSPWSCVRRISDLLPREEFERTALYKELYIPENIYHSLQTILIYNDTLLGIFALFRPKDQDNFSQRDKDLLDAIKEHLALKLYQLIQADSVSPPAGASLSHQFGFTRREQEIVNLILKGQENEEICAALYITIATLRKHLSNIYQKTHVSNRSQLYYLFQSKGE